MMKIKAVLTFVVLAAVSAPVVLAQKYNGLIDKTVAIIGNEMILLSDVESMAQEMEFNGYVSDRNLRCEVLENLMVNKIFYTQAVLDSITVNPDMVNAALNDKMNYILVQFGGEAAAEEYFQKPMHRLREWMRERIMEQNMASEMQRGVAGKVGEVTPREVEQYYRRLPKDSLPEIPTEYQISQIVLYPDVDRAKMEVRERLLEFRQRVLDGEKFSLLATLYSEDPGSAMRGGELGMAPKSVFLWRLGSNMCRIIGHTDRCRVDFAKLIARKYLLSRSQVFVVRCREGDFPQSHRLPGGKLRLSRPSNGINRL